MNEKIELSKTELISLGFSLFALGWALAPPWSKDATVEEKKSNPYIIEGQDCYEAGVEFNHNPYRYTMDAPWAEETKSQLWMRGWVSAKKRDGGRYSDGP